MRYMKKSVGICMAAVLTGCAGVQIYTPKQAGTTEVDQLKGIPFRLKVPVWVQETRHAEYGWLVQFSVDDGDASTALETVPASGPKLIKCASEDAIFAAAELLSQDAKKAGDADAAVWAINNGISSLDKLANSIPAGACRKTVANLLKQESRITDKVYFINHTIPLFGTSSGTYKFATDGTLSEATTSATDETASTLLGLFPLKEKLLKRWKLTPPAAAGLARPFFVTLTLAPHVTQYSLRKDRTLADPDVAAARPALQAPLDLQDGLVGANDIELIAIEHSNEKTPEKSNPKAFRIQGSIVPPET